MNAAKKILAGLLFAIGLQILLLGAIDLADRSQTQESKEGALVAMVLFGLPSIAVATGLTLNLRQQKRQQHKQLTLKQEQTFLQLLHERGGTITAANFALATKTSLEEANRYLDHKAKQLDADFEVGSDREIVYRFPL